MVEEGRAAVSYQGAPGFLYILHRGSSVTSFSELVSTNYGTPIGKPAVQEFSVSLDLEAAFFYIERQPIPPTPGASNLITKSLTLLSSCDFEEVERIPQLQWVELSVAEVAALPPPVLYRIQIFAADGLNPLDPNFSETLAKTKPLSEPVTPYSGYIVVDDILLEAGKPYYWRVRPEAGVNVFGPWSSFCKFMPAVRALTPPAIIGPTIVYDENGVVTGDVNLESNTPTLRWERVGTALSYRLEVFEEDPAALGFPERSHPVFDQTVDAAAGVQFVWPSDQPLQRGRTYFWRIRSGSGAQAGIWSPFAEFRIRAG